MRINIFSDCLMFASNSNSEVSIFCSLFSSLNLLVAVCLSIERRFYSLARAEGEDEKSHWMLNPYDRKRYVL